MKKKNLLWKSLWLAVPFYKLQSLTFIFIIKVKWPKITALIKEYLKERKQTKKPSYQPINNEEEENKESEALIKKADKKSDIDRLEIFFRIITYSKLLFIINIFIFFFETKKKRRTIILSNFA